MRSRAAAVAAGAVMLALAFEAVPSAAATTPARPAAVAVTAPRAAAPSLSKADEARLVAALRASRSSAPYRYTTAAFAKWYAARRLARTAGWGTAQMKCLAPLWQRESRWSFRSTSPTGKYLGIPQTTKSQIRGYGYSVTAFRANPEIQVLVGLRYVKGTYGSPCRAWSFWQAHGWY